ncbi:Serotonin receptor [Operophtera brumata]|uniref:Serotonin receptor n=1 Tax=Operophtera brumata TaxID=104452 RepID=A0A0L7LSK7_OPEBR|nr:Serotonin receptor [Operophtera brumata]
MLLIEGASPDLNGAVQPRGETTVTWWASAVSMAVVSLATVVGNAAVLTALRRLQRAPAHYPLASLAAADLLTLEGLKTFSYKNHPLDYLPDWSLCSCWTMLDVLSCTASILSICLLGWERWCGITAPLARARRAKRARIYAALIWPVSATVAVPTAFIPSPVHYLPGEIPKVCTVNTNVGAFIHSRQRRATRTIVMLMALFLVCWTPFFVMLPLDSLCNCVWDVAWQWCSWLGYANSALNPIVYAAASPSIRRALHASFSTSSAKTTDIPLTSSVKQP